MAKRDVQKPKRQSSPGTPVPEASAAQIAPASSPADRNLDQRLKSIEAECLRLKTDVETAKARVAELEAQRKEVANRVDWVIESLHNILEDGG